MKLLKGIFWDETSGKPVNYRNMYGFQIAESEQQFLQGQDGTLRELTIDEQVDFLYSKALNGTAKEYREILDWYCGIWIDKTEGDTEYAESKEYELHVTFCTADKNHDAKEQACYELKQCLQHEQALNQANDHE